MLGEFPMGNQEGRKEEREVNPYVWEKLSPGRHLSCIALCEGPRTEKRLIAEILPSGKVTCNSDRVQLVGRFLASYFEQLDLSKGMDQNVFSWFCE